MKAYLDALQRYADFTGRSTRAQFWMFELIHPIVWFGLFTVDHQRGGFPLIEGLPLLQLSGFYFLALLIPSLAVLVRRLHDVGRNGVWYFIILVPIIGPLVLLYFLVQSGDAGENEFGHDPNLELEF